MTGGASFNEVFFNEVRVPDDHRLGEVNGGWSVALTTLMNERAAIGAGGCGGGGLLTRADRDGQGASASHDDPVVRQRLADLLIHAPRRQLHQPAGGWTRSGPASCPARS